jgi:hypothetical protein
MYHNMGKYKDLPQDEKIKGIAIFTTLCSISTTLLTQVPPHHPTPSQHISQQYHPTPPQHISPLHYTKLFTDCVGRSLMRVLRLGSD